MSKSQFGKMDSNSRANPRVSVIIPTYNRAQLVRRAIQSVLNQTYQDFEIIVVDDGSTDNTTEVVNSIGDERVRCIRHQVNKGASASRNTGIRAARGELIGFLDSDDEWLPEKLQRQVDKFDVASANVGLVYGGYVVIDDETKKVIGQVHPEKRGYVFKEVLKASHPPNPLTPLIKKECFDKVGLFDEDIRFGEDWDMWLRIAEHYEFDFVNEMVAKYYVSQHQITRDRVSALEELSKFRAKHQQQLAQNPAILAHQLKWIGHWYLVYGDYAAARKYISQAIRSHPRGVLLYFCWLAVYTMPGLHRAVLKSKLSASFGKYIVLFRKLTRMT
jgi:glycosyltransferase involved in cell wall biosynthesis